MKKKILFALMIFLGVFTVGGIVWVFVNEHLETKRYIEWLNKVEKIEKESKV